MGRPPCCDKVGVKKGPWTPEEDITLVSYVQEHGPGNWKAVPTSAGLKRCSKSCRLRWTNYLRPGIKRGSFTDQEEKMIIQLQTLLGNKWAAISCYLPERTDNDIKNYWNTHLKKKLKKIQSGSITDQPNCKADHKGFSTNSHSVSRGQWERRLQADINTAKQALNDALSFENTIHSPQAALQTPSDSTKPGQGMSYASSTGNIARLLKGWVKATPKSEESKCSSTDQNSSNVVNMDSCSSEETPPITPSIGSKFRIDLSEPLFGFETFESSLSGGFSRSPRQSPEKIKAEPVALAPLSMLESWLLQDDHQGKDYLTHCTFDDNPELLI